MIKKLLALLIVAATFGFANTASENTLPSSVFFQDSIKAEQQAALTQVDFDEYYENLIDSEKNMIRKATTMSIVSGAVTGFGIFTTVIAFSGNNEHKNDWIDTYKHSLQIAGIGLTAAGIFGQAVSPLLHRARRMPMGEERGVRSSGRGCTVRV